MRILLLGKKSQLAQQILRECSLKNIEVESYGSKELDITNFKQLDYRIQNFAGKFVINTAAWTNVDSAELNKEKAWEVNAVGPKYLAELCKNRNLNLTHISTDYVFSGSTNEPWSTNDKTEPINFYGFSKLQGEINIKNTYPQGSQIIRTSWLYSIYGSNFVKKILWKTIKAKEPFPVNSSGTGQPTSARELAKTVIEVLIHEIQPGTYHASGAGHTTWFEFATSILNFAGLDESLIYPSALNVSNGKLALRPNYTVLSHDCWLGTKVKPMKEWREVLRSEITEIKKTVEQEIENEI